MKDIVIIIVNYNLTKEIELMLISIRKFVKKKNIQITLVDNNSPDQSIRSIVEKFPEVEFIFLDKNYGFGYANNVGVKNTPSKYYLFLNPDTRFIMDSISDLFYFMESNKFIGVVGPQLVYENGDKQISGLGVANFYYFLFDLLHIQLPFIKLEKFIKEKFSSEDYYLVGYVLGACLMIRQEVINEIGLFDEDYFLFAEEEDLCLRVKKYTNFKVAFWKGTKLIHSKGKITSKVRSQRIKWLYESKLILFNKQFNLVKRISFRFLVILLLIKWLITALIKFWKKDRRELIYTYLYLLKYYIKGKPKLNQTTQDL